MEMNFKSEDSTDRAVQLSALMDGELEPGALAEVCGRWRDDEQLRARWHSYHLVGDVMRSEDLSSTAARDAAFLSRLRLQLEAEPVVLAPEPLPATVATQKLADSRWRRSWRSSAVAAAGFVVVAVGAVNMLRPESVGIQSASAPATPSGMAGPTVRNVAGAGPRVLGTEPTDIVVNGTLIRDARLDQYMAAHQQLSGGSLLGGHAAFLRQAVTHAPRR
jgi:sigma-E factor negative regulatory protein RseA